MVLLGLSVFYGFHEFFFFFLSCFLLENCKFEKKKENCKFVNFLKNSKNDLVVKTW